MTPQLKPVLKALAQRFSPISSKLYILIYNISAQATTSLPSCSSSHFSHAPTTAAATTTSSTSDSKEAILTSLGIPPSLADHSDYSLQTSYKKYKAHLEACHTYNQMLSDGVWTGNRLTAIDLVELFVSKSFWNSHVKKYCLQVSNHLLIVEWLEITQRILMCGVLKSPTTHLRT